MKKKNFGNITALVLICCALIFGGVMFGKTVGGKATDGSKDIYLSEDFSADGIPAGWTYKGYAGSSAVVSGGKLHIDATAGAAEIRLPKMLSADFVMTFDATRVSGADSFSVKYGIQKDSSGHEIEMNVLQKDRNAPFYYYGNTGPDDCYGAEYRRISRSDVEKGINESKIYAFNFYYEEIAENTKYGYTMIRVGKTVEFYVNGTRLLDDTCTEYKDGDLLLRVAKGMVFDFDNVVIYSKTGWAEKAIRDVGYSEGFDEKTALDNADKILYARKYCERYLTKNEFDKLDGVQEYSAFTTLYDSTQSPALEISNESDIPSKLAKETVYTLPSATARDIKGNPLTVSYSVEFNGKYLATDGGVVEFNEAGTYTLTVIARDASGYKTEKSFEIIVE